jgi:hypothetical protein
MQVAILGACAFVVYLWLFRPTEQRLALASKLGIGIGEYSPFPLGYFAATLPPGSSMEMVHMTVLGYARVVQCHYANGNAREVYYFYSRNDSDALRIEIWYDELWRVTDILGEDDDSRTIYIEEGECVPGRLGETGE